MELNDIFSDGEKPADSPQRRAFVPLTSNATQADEASEPTAAEEPSVLRVNSKEFREDNNSQARKKSPALLMSGIALAVLALGGIGGFILMSGGESGPTPNFPAAAKPTESASPFAPNPAASGDTAAGGSSAGPTEGTASEGLSSDTTSTSPSGVTAGDAGTTGGATTEPTDAPIVDVPEITTIEATLPIQFGDRSAFISNKAKKDIQNLVDRMAPGERVAVSTYAGFSASDDWAPQIAQMRADAVVDYLESLGVEDIIAVPLGRSPASLDGASAKALKKAGITNNRLAILSAVTVAPEPAQ